MNTGSIKREDIVQVDIRGDCFYGVVEAKGREQDVRLGPREIRIRPLTSSRGQIRHVTARQIVGHYRKAKGSR